jgi:uncharacterized phage protein gp47/JayE
MPYTLASILTPRTPTQVRDAMLASLGSAGFPVTSWREGGAARTLVEVAAEGVSQAWALAAALANGALLSRAEADWLTELARSHYQVERQPATFAAGYVRLTAAAGAGPYNIGAAALVVSDGTRYYRSTNTATVVVPAGSHVDVPVRAERAGTAYNQPTLGILVSPALPGVTVTSPAWGGGASWRTVDARDEESDAALRARCIARWATLASGFTRDAVTYWCTSATFTDGTPVGCTRVGFGAVDGMGGYIVYVAGASGALGATGRARVQAVLNERKPITDTPSVIDATQVTLTVAGTVQFKSGFNTASNQSAVDAAIKAHVNGKGIGDPAPIDLGALYASIYSAVPGGVQNVDLASPPGDAPIAPGTVVVADTAGLSFS